ncbi:fec operon regulator FecR [compost metagenome]
MLLADNLPLSDFVTELARYRRGLLRCDPAIASLRVSGTFPVGNPRQALAMLEATYPVDIASRLGGYWITVLPRSR